MHVLDAYIYDGAFLGKTGKISICREFYYKGRHLDYIIGGSLYEIDHGYRYFYQWLYFVARRDSSHSDRDQ